MLIVEQYTKKFKHLVELERCEQMRIHSQEMNYLSGEARERKGRAHLHLAARKPKIGLGGKFIVKFTKTRGEQLADTEISVGDLVMISRGNPLKKSNPTGTVAEKTRRSITVCFDSAPPVSILKSRDIRLDLYVNDTTFKRMLDAISEFSQAQGKRLVNMRGCVLGFKEPGFSKSHPVDFFNKKLNPSQKNAVIKALSSKDFFLVHGPPGTGKTLTCVEIIEQIVKRGEKVLASADSNTAVDNLLEKLIKRGVGAIRVGHPARVSPALRGHTLDYIIEGHKLYKKAEGLREEGFKLKDRQKYLTAPTARWKRGMSDAKIRSLANTGRGSRGISNQKLWEMKSWLEIQENANELFKRAQDYEKKAVDEILDGADVICSTNSNSGSEIMGERTFDVAVVDEATQSTEPACLIPIVRAKRCIMAGDHHQLPPTILSPQAQEMGLSVSLFERMMDMYPGIENFSEMLKVQYRMNEKIMKFPGNEFYGNNLIADGSVKFHKLCDLEHVSGEKNPPVIFIDTSQFPDRTERVRPGSTSKQNILEAEIVIKSLESLFKMGVRSCEIAVISPYDDQVSLIKSMVSSGANLVDYLDDSDDLEIKTVDGFQGREKEVVVLSFTRSNEGGRIGFLNDLRRLNVAITRARRKLILIGDTRTISAHPVYSRLVEYVRREGKIFDGRYFKGNF